MFVRTFSGRLGGVLWEGRALRKAFRMLRRQPVQKILKAEIVYGVGSVQYRKAEARYGSRVSDYERGWADAGARKNVPVEVVAADLTRFKEWERGFKAFTGQHVM